MLPLLLLLFFTRQVLAAGDLFFYLSEAEPLCFLDDVVEGATILVKYAHPSTSSLPVVVRIHDPHGVVVSERRAAETGRLAYAAKEVGEHKICTLADPKAKSWPAATKTAKFSIKIDIVSSTTAEVADANIAKLSHVKGLETELNELASVVDLLLQDMQLARQRETHFRDQSERINSRVVWWSVLQTLILIVAGVMQSLHLRAFFISKKIA